MWPWQSVDISQFVIISLPGFLKLFRMKNSIVGSENL